MGKMVVMGSDPHKVADVVDIDSLDFEVVSQWDTALCGSFHKGEIVYCWRMNESFCPVVYLPSTDRLYLCAEYKRYASFKKWLERFYPLASQVSHYMPTRAWR